VNIHEYQAKGILKKYGLKVPRGEVISQGESVQEVAKKIGSSAWVVKAQVQTGGRGKAGGIKIAKTLEELKQYTQQILSNPLKTYQSGDAAKKVKKVLIEELCSISKELYLAITIDRLCSKIIIVASSQGGVEIEDTARKSPQSIFKEYLEPVAGLTTEQARDVSLKLGITDTDLLDKSIKFMMNFYTLFVQSDCLLAEINPLVITQEDELVALDAKLQFDDSALDRHSEIAQMRDLTEEIPQETIARQNNLSYIVLEGNIGCMVNGAGLAMATMDTIKIYGGQPANFLDVGGGASAEMVNEAFKILMSDEKVKAILVNIFGGILKCDVLADGIVTACKKIKPKVPLIVRLEGTNVEEGRQILKDSDLDIISEATMEEAAKRAVELANRA